MTAQAAKGSKTKKATEKKATKTPAKKISGSTVNAQADEIKKIALDKLVQSSDNARRGEVIEIADLLASMKGRMERGRAPLLQNLVVRAVGEGFYDVLCGQRRLLTLKQLAKDGVIPDEFPVPCLMGDDDGALEDSASENLIRKDMHPADEFQVFAGLIEKGRTPAQIAARFNLKQEQVKRRLALASVSPVLIERFRRDEIEIEQVMALTLTDDHALQEQIMAAGKKGPSAWEIKRRLSDGTVSSTDKRVTFVGLKAYEKAGGQRVADLFARASDIDDGKTEFLLADEGLIERLALEKLKEYGDKWAAHNGQTAWVEARVYFEHWNCKEFKKMPMLTREDNPEESEQRKAYEQELKAIRTRQLEIENIGGESKALDDEYESLEERNDEITDKITELDERKKIPHPELSKVVGVVVSLDYNGKPKLSTGLVRAEDAKEADKVISAQGVTSKGKNAGDDQAEPMSLMQEMTSVRSVVLQHSLANNQGFALRVLAFQIAARILEDCTFPNSGVNVTLVDEREFHSGAVASIAGTPLTDELAAKAKQWSEILGPDEESLWTWCMAAGEQDVLALLGYCTAAAYSDVRQREDVDGRTRAVSMLDQMNVSVSDHWKPTAENYFGKLKKDRLIQILGDKAPSGASEMKRAALAKIAEEIMTPAGWMPPAMG